MGNPRLRSSKLVYPARVVHSRLIKRYGLPELWEKVIKDGNYSVIASGRTGCLHEDTLIQTSTRNIKIKDCPTHFMVRSFNFEKECAETKPAMKIHSGRKMLYKLKLSNGADVVASRDHVFFTARAKSVSEKRLKDLKKGDEIFVTKK